MERFPALWTWPDCHEIQRNEIEQLRKVGLKTDHDVAALLTWLKDPIVGTKHNCKNDDHCSPFKFISDVLLGRVQNYIVWANRAGSKSYLAALITWVKSGFWPMVETTILGGSFEQSEKSYKAMNDFWIATKLQDEWLLGEPQRGGTKWVNGSRVSVLTASTKSTRGPHPQCLLMDEIDEMDEEVYKAALSQPQSKHGIKASLGRLSTNHKNGGVMDQALERSRDTGSAIFKWCIWECLEPCKDYSCSTCKISSYCPGPHMKESNGYYLIEDLVSKFCELSDMTLRVEWLSEKIGRDDLVYGGQFDDDVHCSMKVPGFDPSKRVKLSLDWGGTDPFSCGAWQDFRKELKAWVRIDEVYMANTTNPRFMKECKSRPWWKNVNEAVADPSRPDLIHEWMEAGVDIMKAGKDAPMGVDAGIEAVRDCLKPILGNPKFLANRKCRDWRREIRTYAEKNGKPIDKDNHAMDETRYFVVTFVREGPAPRIRRTS